MALALNLGRRGIGRVWPNPAVGCVIVNAGQIVGRGWTADGGRPHAETRALAQANARARGAIAYVTLEPCAHHGQTPPCAAALIAAGVARVVIAAGDPDARVAGRGIAMLRDAGIHVTTGICEDTAKRDHAGFLRRVTTGRPFVTLKLASSFDGRIATKSGESQWITGPDARRAVHMMRARHDAVLVGGGTARADDPTLTVRGLGVTRQPVRVVASKTLDLPIDGALARTMDMAPVWICHGPDADPDLIAAWTALGATLLECGLYHGHLGPSAIVQALGGAGLTRVFCEGGGAFGAAILRAGLVDQLVGFTAGVVLGGDGIPSLGPMSDGPLADAPRFILRDVRRIGPDIMHVWDAP